MSALWSSIRWPFFAAVAVAAFVLGYVGFRDYFRSTGVDRSATDLIYLTIQLFTLGSGSVPETAAPWQLDVARYAAPLASATAVVTALVAAFRHQIEDWRRRRARNHVVVCGLGARGGRLARELLETGHRVIGVEVDGQCPSIPGLRRRGAHVVVGDARDGLTLAHARLGLATHLVCLTGADDTNAEIALRAAELVASRSGSALTCMVHIRDPDLCVLLRSAELAAPQRGGVRLDFFNIDEHGARVLVHDHPPFRTADAGAVPRVVVVGSSRLGQSLVVELARRWRANPAARGRAMEIVVVDPCATDVVRRLRGTYPQLDATAEVVAVDAELDPFDAESVGGGTPDAVYVCVAEESSSLQAALRISHALAGPDTPVVVELLQSPGMAALIDRPNSTGNVRAFNVADRAMGSDLLLGGTYEILARAIHDEYVEAQRREGATVETNASMVPWDQLSPSLQESNRDQAAHIGAKLAAVGCGIAPLRDWDADERFSFSPEQVELLAEREHERWVAQRLRDGWTSGPKDVEAKKTPYLGPWDSLSDEVKELDRQAVRGIPAFLARAGYQIVSPSRGPRPGESPRP